jgi:hypothetical protein
VFLVTWPAKRGVAWACRCVAAQGEGGVASAGPCRAGVHKEWGWRRYGCTGTPMHALRALAARSTPVWHGRGGTHGRLRAGLA